MKYRTLGKTRLEVSEIGFGGIPIQRLPKEEAAAIVKKAYQSGINFFDTARGYTDSEEKIGKALSAIPRNEIIVATKSRVRNKQKVKEDVDRSLHLLRTDYIDLYQIHNVSNSEELDLIFSEDVTGALREAQKEGKIRYIGLTSHNTEIAASALQQENFDTVQFPLNPLELEATADILPLAQEKNIGTIIMKPLCGGAIEQKELALRYLLDFPVSTIIPGMQSEEEITQNIAVTQQNKLTEEEKNKLEAEVHVLGTRFCRRCEYCLPCPEDIHITFNLLMLGYYRRYGLHQWASERYHSQKVKASACHDCGLCEERCPYHLPVREMLRECREIFE